MSDATLTFGVDCPHILRLRRSVTGPVMAACGLVEKAVGGMVYRFEEACRGCSQADDGRSPASEAINRRLFDRLSRGWAVERSDDAETSAGCGNHYRQDVLAAADMLAARSGPLAVGAAIMTAMIRHTMPLDIGEAIVATVAPCAHRGAQNSVTAWAESCAGVFAVHTFPCALHKADVTLEHCVHCLSAGGGAEGEAARSAVRALIARNRRAG